MSMNEYQNHTTKEKRYEQWKKANVLEHALDCLPEQCDKETAFQNLVVMGCSESDFVLFQRKPYLTPNKAKVNRESVKAKKTLFLFLFFLFGENLNEIREKSKAFACRTKYKSAVCSDNYRPSSIRPVCDSSVLYPFSWKTQYRRERKKKVSLVLRKRLSENRKRRPRKRSLYPIKSRQARYRESSAVHNAQEPRAFKPSFSFSVSKVRM